MSKKEEPAIGIPYAGPPYPGAQPGLPYPGAQPGPPYPGTQPGMYPPPQQYFHAANNPYQAGVVPPNAIVGDPPKGIPLIQTIYRDTPAPFTCNFCGYSGTTYVKSKPSVAAFIGCMTPFCLGICFLCPALDCLWHKYHHCSLCGEKVAEFKKSDPCAVMDPPNWVEESFALTS